MDRPVKETDGMGSVNALKYDEFGNIVKEVNQIIIVRQQMMV
ncbi:MAG: hypothetical protein ACYDG2_17540 [Ruminiclostridium sp.]